MKYLQTCCFIDFNNLYVQNNQAYIYKYEIKKIIEKLIKDFYVIHFISGMEFGLEQFFSEAVIELKKEYAGITLEAALAYETFTIRWSEKQRDKYYSLMQKVDKETLLQYNFTKDCIRKKNRYMIKKSNYIILPYNNTNEINNFILQAKANKKIVFLIEPEVFGREASFNRAYYI